MAKPLANHDVFFAYLISLAWLATTALLYSLTGGRPTTGLWVVCGLLVGVTTVYGASMWLAHQLWPAAVGRAFQADAAPPALDATRQLWLQLLVLTYGLVVLAHFLLIGYIPIVSALHSSSDIGVSLIRQAGYFDLPLFMRYASDYCLKAVGPALLLISYYLRSRMFWVILLIGSFYSLALLVRVLPLILLAPLLVFMLIRRRWLPAVLVFGLMCLMVVALTSVSSIPIRKALSEYSSQVIVMIDDAPSVSKSYNNYPKKPPDVDQDWRRSSALYAIYERALIVPGQVMDQWFYYYEGSDRREHGCGYTVLARLQGCEYVHIPSKLYAVFYQENISQGMLGSLNAPWFMTDYANWGYAGLAFSALMGGLLFALVALIYRDHPLALPMNLPLIVASMESNLMTAINSGGGWLVMTLLFILFFRSSRQR